MCPKRSEDIRGYTSVDMAEDLYQLLNHLDITKAHLVGHRFGGVVALRYAADHPEGVASLTTADSRVHVGGWNGGQRTAERWIELLRTTTARQDLTSQAGLTIERLSTIRAPALLIWGENSPTMQSFRGLKEHLPDCRAVVIPGAGHFYALTQPKIFVGMGSRFLKEVADG
jgi:pimeloyl-ACP methyl ester carboxylesterase